MTRFSAKVSILVAICPLMVAGVVSAQDPFACTGEAFIIQDPSAQLTQVDQTTDPFGFNDIGGPAGFEVNNLGFRRADGLLYAVQLTATGNAGLIQIDRDGDIFNIGMPVGLPTSPAISARFAAGDVTPDGSTMYLNTNGSGTLWSVTLPGQVVSSVAINTAAGSGIVFDWAVSPIDGFLYGGDQTGGQLARLDPATGTRTDFNVGGGGIPSGTAYGGAWFNAAGTLFLYRNNGEIYEIDVSGPTLLDTQTGGPSSSNNDGAACIQDVIGVAKHMTSAGAGFPDTVTIDYTFENLGSETLDNLSALDDLDAVFGPTAAGPCAFPTGSPHWLFTSISSSTGTFHNASYDGSSDTELIAAGQSLTSGSSATIQVVISLCNQEMATPPNPPGTGGPPYLFFNSVLFTGTNPGGTEFGDISHDDGTTTPDPDPDMNDSPDERTPAQVPVELMEFGID